MIISNTQKHNTFNRKERKGVYARFAKYFFAVFAVGWLHLQRLEKTITFNYKCKLLVQEIGAKY